MKSSTDDIRPCEWCGYKFDHERLGRYGCPNCLGEPLDGEAEKLWQESDEPHRQEPDNIGVYTMDEYIEGLNKLHDFACLQVRRRHHQAMIKDLKFWTDRAKVLASELKIIEDYQR